MSIWNKVFIGLILVASLAFFYLAARALKTHQYWRDISRMHEDALLAEVEQEQKLIEGVDEGEEAAWGIRQTSLELHKVMLDRGRVWYGCKPQQVDLETGAASVMTDLPDPHQIQVHTVLWVFDERDVQDGGRYLGQFAVTNVAERQLQLQPSMKMGQQERNRLQQSSTKNDVTWVLYEVMPVDDHEIFVGLDDAEKEAMLPAGSAAEYLADGQLITTEEVETKGLQGKVVAVDENGVVVRGKDGLNEEVENGKGEYVRPLHDYEVLFREYHRQEVERGDLFAARTRDRQSVEAAVKDADRQKGFREEEIDQLKEELANRARERDAVAALRKDVQDKLKSNQTMAGEIARIQLEATRRIDEQTRKAAEAGVGS